MEVFCASDGRLITGKRQSGVFPLLASEGHVCRNIPKKNPAGAGFSVSLYPKSPCLSGDDVRRLEALRSLLDIIGDRLTFV